MKAQICRACVWSFVLQLAVTGSVQADGPTGQLGSKSLPKLPPLPPSKSSPRLPTRSSAKESPDRLAYKLTQGQIVGYRIDIQADFADKVERFYGTPVFTVHSILKDGTAELAAVGRLALSTRSRSKGDLMPQPGNDVWLRSYLKVPPNGPSSAKDELNVKRLPGELHLFTKPSHLVFVELPKRVGNQSRWEGTSSLFETRTGSLLGPTFSSTKGRETNLTRSEPESGSIYRIIKEKGFRTTEGTPREWQYQSTSRFDKNRGLVLSTEATLTQEENGQKSASVKISVCVLDGGELARARSQAETDRARMPAELEPLELKRVRLDLKSASRFKSGNDLKPGMAVAHFLSAGRGYGDNHWYHADVLDVLTDYKVKVRLRGSKEEFDVHPGELALLPADKASR
jgi:hypothetical protein